MLGRLTAPPDFRMTPNNEAVCRFRIAVPRTKEKSDFFNIVAWDKIAETVSRYFTQGDRILVEGGLRNADYEDKNGVKHYAYEIIANRIEFIELKNREEN
jgi:single-strand DNA-binding protein